MEPPDATVSKKGAVEPMEVEIENSVGLTIEWTKYVFPATIPQITVFSNTTGFDTLRNNAHRGELQIKLVEVHDATKKVLELAFVIVTEPVASDNATAGPLAEVDKTTCELLIILRIK